MPARSRSVPTKSQSPLNRPLPNAIWPSRLSGPARAGCIGWSRWSRSLRHKDVFAFGPLTETDVAPVFDAMMADGPHAPAAWASADEIPWLKRQTRLTFARCGVIDPRSVDDYRAHEGYRGLQRALTLGTDGILADVTASGLRGRGGADFRPASNGRRWRRPAPTANSSSATPTKATAALLLTA